MQKNDFKGKDPEPSDEQLAVSAAKGDDAALTVLTVRYMPIVAGRALGYFSDGYDSDDLIQVGMIGLIKAIRSFSPEKGASFHTFALLCIDRNIISAVRMSLSAKRIPPSSLLYIDQSDDDSPDAESLLYDRKPNPEDAIISKDTVERINARLSGLLSKTEFEVFELYLKGCSYDTIAERLSISRKSVDNAVCRAKGKLKNYIRLFEDKYDMPQ